VVSHSEADGETFEFRLFASKPKPVRDSEDLLTNNEYVKVNIRSPTPLSAPGDGGFVVPFRPQSYYFTAARDRGGRERRKEEYGKVALGGEEVMSLARGTAWVRQNPQPLQAYGNN